MGWAKSRRRVELENKSYRIMKNAVLVTSAIMVDGMEESRLAQTIHTFDSIRLRIPNSSIFLVECSQKDLTHNIQEEIEKNGVQVIKMNEYERLHEISKNSKNIDNVYLGYLKNATEIFALNTIINEYDFSDYDRICKISGRYFLNTRFDWSLNDAEKFTISIEYPSPRYENMKAHQCTYWSFPVKHIEEYKQLFRIIEEWLINSWKDNKQLDIEHGLWVFIGFLNISANKIHPLGVTGLTRGEVLNIH